MARDLVPRRRPDVIAHRGACGYLPEHTLAAKALAFAMGADYLEQDVVATRDNELLVVHDIILDATTDIATRFPGRQRADGHWYARDFTLAEIRTLNVTERLNSQGEAHYPTRFPAHRSRFGVVTLAEELEFVAGLNASTGRDIGVYPEIKRPAWHRAEGVELGDLLLDCLDNFGLRRRTDKVFVQCFDFDELVRLREHCKSDLPLIQLVGENHWRESPTDYDWLRSPPGLEAVAAIADGIGPWLEQLLPVAAERPGGRAQDLMNAAHGAGLLVHPYTLRADDLPAGFDTLEQLLHWACTIAGVDGFFTDFTDRAVRFVDALPR